MNDREGETASQFAEMIFWTYSWSLEVAVDLNEDMKNEASQEYKKEIESQSATLYFHSKTCISC